MVAFPEPGTPGNKTRKEPLKGGVWVLISTILHSE